MQPLSLLQTSNSMEPVISSALIGGIGSIVSTYISTESQKQQNQERIASQERIESMRLTWQRIQHEENMGQRDADRQHQYLLSELNREFQSGENVLNRELQAQLTTLNQEFQAQQGAVSRAFAEKMEIFKADLQAYFFNEQRELQLKMKAEDIALARELRASDRNTALEVIREQKKQNQSPILILTEDLLSKNDDVAVLPLHIFLSPPKINHDRSKDNSNTNNSFPDCEQHLQEELRKIFREYETKNRPVDYLGGAWASKQMGNETAARQIFLALKSEPTLILEDKLEGGKLFISYAYWGLGHPKERYMTAMSFSWMEALNDFAKARTETWFRNREADGTTEAEWIADYGEEVVRKYQDNRKMIDRERRSAERGEDVRELRRQYNFFPRDTDELMQYIATCHALVAGWTADEYFMLDVDPSYRRHPLFPKLLPSLLQKISEKFRGQFIAESIEVYKGLYRRSIAEAQCWEPERRLELANCLIELTAVSAAQAEVDLSLQVWLADRGINWDRSEAVLPLLAKVATPEDEGYFSALYDTWRRLEIDNRVDMGQAFLRRGEDFLRRRNYDAAIADFEQARSLGVLRAADRLDVVTHVRAEIAAEQLRQEQAKMARLRWEQAEAERQRLAAEQLIREQEAARQREVERLRQLEETRQREAQEKIDREQGRPFSFTTVRVNSGGQVMEKLDLEARCLTVDLGAGTGLEMVQIPGGSFLIGAPASETNSDNRERPQHQVTLPTFHMSKYPITQRQYQALIGSNPSTFKGEQRPVENVSWHDAVEFCRRLSAHTGHPYSLASEAQWEYACRAGTTTPFYFGATISSELANYDANYTYDNGPKGVYRQQTCDVGSFAPNAFGLYDMHGNVWEWCQDAWHSDYNGAPTDGSVWNGDSSTYILRGGSWLNIPYGYRSAFRNYGAPVNRYDYIGFRVVLVAPRT
jgi:formylglycine-generating enzyme required for sulfatase activity